MFGKEKFSEAIGSWISRSRFVGAFSLGNALFAINSAGLHDTEVSCKVRKKDKP
jgi:hypothetical protein